MSKSKPRVWDLGGTEKTQAFIKAVAPLVVANGAPESGIATLRVDAFYEGDFRISATFGSSRNPAIDLRDRAALALNPLARSLLDILASYTDEEVAEAISSRFAWSHTNLTIGSGSDTDGRYWEVASGKDPYELRDSIKKIADMADMLKG